MTKIEQIRASQAAKPVKAARTKQQRADAPSTPLKGTQAFVQEPITVHSAESELDSAYSDYERAQTRLLSAMGTVGWKRIAASFIASFCVGYGIGWLAGLALEAIAMGTLALTGSATAAIVVWVIGVMLTIAAAMYVGRIVGTAVYDGTAQTYVVSKYTAAKNRIGAIFDRKDIELGSAHA